MEFIVTAELDGKQHTVDIDPSQLQASDRPGVYHGMIDGVSVPVFIRTDGIDNVKLSVRGYEYSMRVLSAQHAELFMMLASSPAARTRSIRVSSPMPGLLKAILVENGSAVKKGETLFTLEAMKMENAIASPIAGTIHSITIQSGSAIEKGALLCVIEP